MSPVNAVTTYNLSPLDRGEALRESKGTHFAATQPASKTESFGKVLDGILSTVVAKDDAADAATRSVLLGESSNLHQAMVAGAESDVAFALMVEVRNKLLESFQELMRMQA